MPYSVCYTITLSSIGWMKEQCIFTLIIVEVKRKNSTMVQYLLFRVMTWLHDEFPLSFMITDYTKFSPDWCFGLLEEAISENSSSRTRGGESVFLSQCCSANQTGRWSSSTYIQLAKLFLNFVTELKGIKILNHLSFISSSPGIVFCKEKANSDETSVCILSPRSPVSFDESPDNFYLQDSR